MSADLGPGGAHDPRVAAPLSSVLRPDRRRRERHMLLATAVCAAGAPLAANAWVSARTDALARHLGAAGGVAVRIAAVDADLTGRIRLTGVELGTLVTADAVEASVGLDSLLAGSLRADEIRVAGPRVAVDVDASGDSDLARLARRLLGRASAARGRTTEPSRLRRIVVSSGTLSAHIAGVGDLTAGGVELIPDTGGIRVTTRTVRLDGRAGPVRVELAFARSAAELTLPALQLGRVLAVGGAGSVIVLPVASGPDPQIRAQVYEVSAGRLAAGGPLELHATIDDAGIPRPVALDVAPHGLAIAVHGDHLPLRMLAPLAPHGLDLTAGHATGSLAVHRDAARLVIDVDASLDDIAIDHRVVAANPVALSARARASIAVSPDAVAVSDAILELGAARWTATGWLRRGSPASGQLDLELATAPCRDLLAALPPELRGPLDGMALAGSFGGRLHLAVDLAAPPGDGVELLTSITGDCRADAEPPAADVALLTGPADQQLLGGSHARIGKGEPGWVTLRQIPSHLAGAFISAEDARFFDHAGFDLTQIAHSLEIDLRERRLIRGGSTISQQLVKNAFLSQRRSFDRKLQEAILTWRLEARLTKPQILERYLNIIELGPRVFGVAAAARYWFATSPRGLSVRQAAFLAALTSEPTAMSRRVRRAGGLDADSAARVDVVLHAMRRDGVISAEQLDDANQAPLRFTTAAKQE